MIGPHQHPVARRLKIFKAEHSVPNRRPCSSGCATGVAGVRKVVLPSVELDLEEPLGDVRVRGPVFTIVPILTRSQVGAGLLDGVDEMQRPRDPTWVVTAWWTSIIVRGGALLGEMHNESRRLLLEDAADEVVVAEVPLVEADLLARELLDGGQAARHGRDGRITDQPDLLDPFAGHEVVNPRDIVSAGEEMQREREYQCEITGDQDTM